MEATSLTLSHYGYCLWYILQGKKKAFIFKIINFSSTRNQDCRDQIKQFILNIKREHDLSQEREIYTCCQVMASALKPVPASQVSCCLEQTASSIFIRDGCSTSNHRKHISMSPVFFKNVSEYFRTGGTSCQEKTADIKEQIFGYILHSKKLQIKASEPKKWCQLVGNRRICAILLLFFH